MAAEAFLAFNIVVWLSKINDWMNESKTFLQSDNVQVQCMCVDSHILIFMTIKAALISIYLNEKWNMWPYLSESSDNSNKIMSRSSLWSFMGRQAFIGVVSWLRAKDCVAQSSQVHMYMFAHTVSLGRNQSDTK